MHRRTFLTAATAFASAKSLLAAAGVDSSRLGICAFSCHQRWKLTQPMNALDFYRYGRELGAEGVQTPLRTAEPQKLRDLVESTGGYFEADLRFPKAEADFPAFEDELRKNREAGASIARGIFTSGRRYEVFKTLADFHAFHEQSKRLLQLIEPVLKKHRLKLAIENHKDHTADELAALMKYLSSEWIGVLVDTGNNIALLDEPHAAVETLAPYALSVHLKDMAVQSAPDGFLLSEVPLGTGFLDLKRMIATLRHANPSIILNLEMATRDPLRIPCLTDTYFTTFPERKATHLAAAMQRVKQNPPTAPVPSVSGKPKDTILTDEEQNNRHGLRWMQKELRA